jgi:hypothetical protein
MDDKFVIFRFPLDDSVGEVLIAGLKDVADNIWLLRDRSEKVIYFSFHLK